MNQLNLDLQMADFDLSMQLAVVVELNELMVEAVKNSDCDPVVLGIVEATSATTIKFIQHITTSVLETSDSLQKLLLKVTG